MADRPKTFDEALAHFTEAARRFAPLIQRGILEEHEARDAIERQIFIGIGSHLTEEQQHALADRALWALWEFIDAPELNAIRDIRITVRKMVEARNPPPEIKLACYRVADGRLPTREVERVFKEEVESILKRVRGRSVRDAG